MKAQTLALLAISTIGLTACATQPTTEHAACVAPCTRDMDRMQFLEDIRASGMEATRMHVVGANEAVAAAARANDATPSTTAKAQ